MNYIIENKEWLFSGIGLAVILGAIKFFSNKPKNSLKNNNNQVTINNNLFPKKADENEDEDEDLASSKDSTRIVFIDDETRFQVVKILQKSGWIHTQLIKDVDTLDQTNIKQANILFVDIQGVGKKLRFKDEGLGLAKALKEKYPDKFVVIYSSETQGDRFHESLRTADDFLQKNADPYQFQQLVEKFAQKLIR